MDCHRAGKKQQKAKKNGVKRRRVLKRSKKKGSRARLTIKCFAGNPSKVYYKVTRGHRKHKPGTISDVKFLKTSSAIKERITRMLESGEYYSVRQIQSTLQQQLSLLPRRHRDRQVRTEAIYHLFRQWRHARARKDVSDFTSVKGWLTGLASMSFTVWQGTLGDEPPYAFGFCSPWQRVLLKQHPYWSLDATHHMGNYTNAVLFTIVIRHAVADRGVPVAYMLTNDQSAATLTEWFRSLADMGAKPTRITIDRDMAALKAIDAVWGDSCTIQLCLWHVQRAWMSQLHTKAVERGRKRILKPTDISIIRDAIKAMTRAADEGTFMQLWETVKSDWGNRQKA